MSIFIQAHQDDWQLCMGSNAYDDLLSIDDASALRILFLYMTAGDAERGDGPWQARERGACASVQHLLQQVAHYNHPEIAKQGNYNGHLIDCMVIGNVTSVFLRLPDIVNPRPSSLEVLSKGGIVGCLGSTQAVYVGWDDLVDTVVAIVEDEGLDTNSFLWFNAIAEGKEAGHRDHDWTARLVSDVYTKVAGSHPDKQVNLAWHQGTNRQVTQADDTISKRVAVLLPYEKELLAFDPTGESNTLSEPLILQRKLLLQQMRG